MNASGQYSGLSEGERLIAQEILAQLTRVTGPEPSMRQTSPHIAEQQPSYHSTVEIPEPKSFLGNTEALYENVSSHNSELGNDDVASSANIFAPSPRIALKNTQTVDPED